VFQGLKDWLERRAALGEIQVREKIGRDFKPFFLEQVEIAYEAFDRGAHQQAYEIWTKTRLRFPALSVTTKRGLNLLLELGRYDEAEALMREGRRRYRANAGSFSADQPAFLSAGSARIAYQRGDVQEAIDLCTILRRKFPHVAEGYTVAAACLFGLNRQDDAEAVIAQGLTKAPGDFEMHKQYARNAMWRRDWPEALRRWKVMSDQFRDQWLGPLGVAQCLREMGRFAEAEEILGGACETFYKSDWLFAEAADLATAKGDLEEAVRRWERVLTRFPGLIVAYPRAAETMNKIGRIAQADELLTFAVNRFQSDIYVHLEYARNAHRREDWGVAADRWGLVCERFPNCEEARQRQVEALAAAKRQASDCDEKATDVAPTPTSGSTLR
jgi:tetratricopeptide (TPR) repeat protein